MPTTNERTATDPPSNSVTCSLADEQTPETVWESFWKPIVAEAGVLDVEQLKKELFDYWHVIHEVALVYDHITGGRVSKPTSDAVVAKELADEHYERLYEREQCDCGFRDVVCAECGAAPGIDAVVNPPSEKQERVFRYGSMGSLVCDIEIPGLTQAINDEDAKRYGGRFFIGETITKSAAKELAEVLGGRLDE